MKSIIDLESLNIFTNLVILDAREAKTEEKEIVSEFSFLEWVYKKKRSMSICMDRNKRKKKRKIGIQSRKRWRSGLIRKQTFRLLWTY